MTIFRGLFKAVRAIKLSIIVKLSALVGAAVIVTALAVNEVYVRGANQILIDRSVEDLQKTAEYVEYPLQGTINQLKGDVALLGNLEAAKGLMRANRNGGVDPSTGATTKEWEDRLANAFEEMLRTRAHYARARYIGVANGGRDILRVERFGPQIQRVPETAFETVNTTAYFQGAIRVAPGEIYLAEPTLERDAGVVRTPHTLVLRSAVQMLDETGKVYAIVLINMNLGAVFQDLLGKMGEHRSLTLANASGDYLIHPDSTALYATDLGHKRRMQADDPRLLDVLGDPKRDVATFIPSDTVNGDVVAFRKFHMDTLNPNNFLSIDVKSPYRDIVAATNAVSQQGFLFSSGVALVALAIGVFLLRLLMKPLNNVADAIVRYRKGEKDIPLPSESPDEIGVLAREFAEMMRQKNEEDWVKENMVAVSRNLLGFKDLPGFASAFLDVLAPAVQAQVGVFYVSSSFAGQLGSKEGETLKFLAAWGWRGGAGEMPRSYRWGEGLVGNCARMRARTVITDLPPDYLRIDSALGEAPPRQLLLLPVLFENTLVGVVELASLNGFTPLQLTLLDQIAFNVGVIMSSINAGVRTQELLEEARQTAEVLQRSEEELKTQQEELEASNEEMGEKTKALEEQNARIRKQSAELEETKRVIEEKAAELELASRYKSEFLANMSHELRTPLNSLLILARGLALNEEGNLTEEQVEEARVIHNGGMELLSLINDILDLSKVEAGKITITAEDIYITNVVKRMTQQFDPVAKERGLTFDIRVDKNLPEAIHTDVQRLEQILKNLLSNAFKFTQKGTVTLEIAASGADSVTFAVIDTGIGIEANKLKDIFEAFQQENGSIDRHYGGTGLGLTIARKFARLLEGEIQVASVKGQGSTFSLRLPLGAGNVSAAPVAGQWQSAASAPAHSFESKASDAKAAPALGAPPKAPVRTFIPDDRKSIGPNDRVVLVIEDDRDFAMTLVKIARGHGYKAIAAGDGKTGLLLATEQHVSAILLDLRLPDIDGMFVLDQLKNDLRTRHIPVHVISGRDASDATAPLRKGAMGYLTKPVSAEALDGVFGRIETLLRAELKKVLVIEDDKNTQVAIHTLLKQKNAEIVIVDSGALALQLLRAGRFDCAILDLKLPDMTGFEWLQAAEREQGENLPPIIVYTARDLTEDENRQLNQHTGSIVIKGANSSERLIDEVTLFLHSMEAALSTDQRAMIRMQHDPDQVLQGRTVLLVDDDLRNTFALSKLLRKHGMNVVIADDGRMALDKLQEEKAIEMVVMDIMMPVMDGYQAMREIRSREQWRSLPILALTARAMPEEQERCIEAGANDYLVKPVDVERLLTLLRVWMFQHKKVA